jgi:hypothetical protein
VAVYAHLGLFDGEDLVVPCGLTVCIAAADWHPLDSVLAEMTVAADIPGRIVRLGGIVAHAAGKIGRAVSKCVEVRS